MTAPTHRADAATALQPDLVALRRALHREPEIGLDLPRTQAKVLDALAGLPVEITLGKALSSVTAVLRGARPGPAVLLRADMDALPVQEETGLPYTSEIPDAMHACGHDMHTAALVGAARLLAERREHLAGSVVFMFQPGEEGGGGANLMLDEGVLEAAGQPVVAAYALHVLSRRLPHGAVATRPGVAMAASDIIRVTVRGRGGHGSSPHAAVDPVPALTAMVGQLQTAITREVDVHDPAVLSVGQLIAGSAPNVIPDTAELHASVRTFSDATHRQMQKIVDRVVRGNAIAHGVEADLDYQVLYPVTVNDPDEAAFALDVARGLVGDEKVQEWAAPASGSEDFSFVLQRVPGAYLFLGACAPEADPDAAQANHSPRACFDDGVLSTAAGLLADLASRRLDREARETRSGKED